MRRLRRLQTPRIPFDPLRLLVDALACYRATRLVVADQLTVRARAKVIEWAYRRAEGGDLRPTLSLAQEAGIDVLTDDAWPEIVANDPDPPKVAYLVTCPWCASVHIAVLVVAARRFLPRAWAPVAEALALSAVAGLVSEKAA